MGVTALSALAAYVTRSYAWLTMSMTQDTQGSCGRM